MNFPRCESYVIFGWMLLSFCPPAQSDTITVGTRDELVKAVEQALPGTTILIAPGTYVGGLQFNDLQGTAGKPIVLTASDAQNPPIFQGRNACFHFTDPAFVELHNLVLTDATGNGLNIDDGGSYDSAAHDIVLRGLTVRNIGPQGNRDGIKLSGVRDFRIEACNIEQWGDGGSGIDMVGCHDGTVAGCTFRHRSNIQANGVQTKGGSANIVIRRCRFENAGGRSVNIGGSTGREYFRPKFEGFEAQDITVEDCTFIGSSAPICFVGVDRAFVRYNTIYRPERYVLQILQESRGSSFVPCRNGVFSHNVIAFRSDEIRGAANIGPETAPNTFKFANNHWYCMDRPERSSRLSLPVMETDSVYGTDPLFTNPEQGDLRLEITAPIRDAGVRPE